MRILLALAVAAVASPTLAAPLNLSPPPFHSTVTPAIPPHDIHDGPPFGVRQDGPPLSHRGPPLDPSHRHGK